jgi:GNAT superfamily N-acetyltransferase
MHYRFATPEDAGILASMNQQLIHAEGHRNPMSVEQLTERMALWLSGEYQAVVLEEATTAVGYALFRKEHGHIFLRQLFVVAERRRRGIGRAAIGWLWRNAWNGAPRLRIEVLVGNVSGREFWRSVGFEEYCVTMEATPPNDA